MHVKLLAILAKCGAEVVAIAHEVPLGGHLGKTKTS